jgi:hypothetical protein
MAGRGVLGPGRRPSEHGTYRYHQTSGALHEALLMPA